jgi:hypothetical protein
VANGGNSERSDRTPSPDPTVLTTQALYREIEGLRELLEQRIDGLGGTVEQKFDLVESQRVEQKKDTKDAVDAALTAQKEAVREQTAASERAIAKSEAATSKQLDQLSVTFTTAIDAIQRELGEGKERLTAIEQRKAGAKEDRTALYASLGALALLIFLVIAVVTFVAASHP